jgi:hypothetical protein
VCAAASGGVGTVGMLHVAGCRAKQAVRDVGGCCKHGFGRLATEARLLPVSRCGQGDAPCARTVRGQREDRLRTVRGYGGAARQGGGARWVVLYVFYVF